MKKFVFVVHRLYGGGAERVVSVLASELAEMGQEVHVIVYNKSEKEYPVSDKVKIYYDRDKEYHGVFFISKFLKVFRIRKVIKEYGDIYLIPFLNDAIIHSFVCTRLLKNVTFVSTIRIDPRHASEGMRDVLAEKIATYADALFAQNENEKSYYSEKVQNKTFIVPNPINELMVNVKHTYNNAIRKIILVGRLVEQKNFKMMINVAEKLEKIVSDFEINIYGEGSEYDMLNNYISELNLRDRVFLRGNTKEIVDKYNESDLFVMTSNFEGMPNALMEAMAIGLPCISTDCQSGPSDLITNMENGILISTNEESELLDSIVFLMNNPKNAIEFGKKARESILANYMPSIIAKKFYDECLKI